MAGNGTIGKFTAGNYTAGNFTMGNATTVNGTYPAVGAAGGPLDEAADAEDTGVLHKIATAASDFADSAGNAISSAYHKTKDFFSDLFG